jgi:hypothetical protein
LQLDRKVSETLDISNSFPTKLGRKSESINPRELESQIVLLKTKQALLVTQSPELGTHPVYTVISFL